MVPVVSVSSYAGVPQTNEAIYLVIQNCNSEQSTTFEVEATPTASQVRL